MADAALNIKIGADVQNALTGIKSVEAASAGLNKVVKETEERFVVQNTALNKSVGYLRQQEQAAKDLANAEKILAANSGQATDGFDKLSSSSRGMLEPLNNAYNAIRKIAYVLPGIGIGGIVSVLFSGVASALSSVGSSTKVVDDATKSLEEHAKVIDSVVSKNKEESATVDILVGKIQSGTLSRQQTITAIKELQKISPEYFGKLNAEKVNIEEVTKAYGNYNNALIKSIETQIHIAEITDLVNKRLAVQTATPNGAKFINDLLAQGKTLEEINAIVTKGIGEDIKAQAQLLQGNKYVSDEKLKQAILDAKVPAGAQEILKFLFQERDLLKDINNVSNLVKLDKVKPDKSVAEERLAFEPVDLKDFLNVDNFDSEIKTIQKKLNPKAFIHLTIGGFNQDELDARAAEMKKIGEHFGQAISGAISDAINSGISGIAEAIGSKSSIFTVLGKVLGNALKAIGQAYIAAALATAAAKKAFESFLISNPYLAVAAGVGLEIAGGLIASSVGKTKAFADGGIVTGPTNALIGEAGPEVVFPLEQLNRFVRSATGASNRNVNVTGEISGNNLKLVLARTNKNQGFAS